MRYLIVCGIWRPLLFKMRSIYILPPLSSCGLDDKSWNEMSCIRHLFINIWWKKDLVSALTVLDIINDSPIVMTNQATLLITINDTERTVVKTNNKAYIGAGVFARLG